MFSNQYQYEPFNSNYRPIHDTNLIQDIQKAINGEYSAIACYEKLAKLAPNKDEREKIQEIQNDEKRHLAQFTSIYRSLTGRQPSYKLSEGCPDQYRAGIVFAFKDEQETVDFYLDIADMAQNPYIKDRFRRAAADEQNHAVWFLSFMHK